MTNKGIHLIIRKFLYAFILLFFVFKSYSQEIENITISGEYINHPLKKFFDTIEEGYDIRFFYKTEWIDSIKINQQFDETPIYQALTRILNNSGCFFEIFQDDAILIFPTQNTGLSGKNMEGLMTIIGDPLNYGRYKNATLSGIIRDGKNREPLVGAVLYVPKLEKGTSTNSEGKFEIELPTDEYNLQLSFMGFEQNYRKIRLIESGEIDLELFEESQNIAEVTVRGEGKNVSRTQMSMLKVDAKGLKELPVLMGEADVIKSITMLAGVQTVSELASGFNVRGGNTDQNLILVNGTPVFNTSHLFGFFSMLNPDVIDDVMLYKGGMPARYGERVSSVMEIELKEGNDEHISIYGGIGLINSRFTIEGPVTKNKKLKFLAGGRTSYSSWLMKQVPDAEISNSTTKFYDISGKATYIFNLHNKISLMAYSSNDEFNTSLETILNYGNTLANLELRNRFSEKLNGELNFSYSQYKSRLSDLANNNDENAFNLDNQLNYLSGKYHFNWYPNERNNINFGVNTIRHKLNPGEIIPRIEESVIAHKKLQEEKSLEIAGYISDEYMLLPNVFVNLGLRYSWFANLGKKTVFLYDDQFAKSPESIVDSVKFSKNKIVKSYGGLEPRIALNYSFTNGYSIKASFQRTRQYMGQISNNAVISPTETWKFSDYYLEPLISDQVAIGFSGDIARYGIQFSSEIYYKKLKNLIEYKNGAEIVMNSHLETELIPSDGYSYGIEISGTKKSGRLTGMINYTFSRTMRRTNGNFDKEKINNNKWYPSVYDKPHDLSIAATYNISRRWRFSCNFVYISGRPVTLPEEKYKYAGQTLIYYSDRNKYRMPSYHRMDLSITLDENLKRKRSWKGSWTLSLYNAYGRQNPYSIYYRKGAISESTGYKPYSLYKLSVIGIPIPTLTYNFRF